MKKIGHSLTGVFALLTAATVGSGCDWQGVRYTHTFLHFKYKLESCADIHGQNNYSQIWFSEYKGTSYSSLFDLSFDKTYLDFNVSVVDGKAKGTGELSVAYKAGGFYLDHVSFSYYCLMLDTTGGRVVSDLPNEFSSFVFCIYWSRINVRFVVPDTQETITITFHFRGGTANPYPDEFKSQ